MMGRAAPGNRIARFRFLDAQGRWVPMNHTPKDLLQWATELKPDFLQRTFSMFPLFTLDRPLPDGFTGGSFLDERARVAGAIHSPRIDINPSVLNETQILELSARLLDMPLTPHLQFLSLDNYTFYAPQKGPDACAKLLQSLLDQGWQGIELLVCGSDRRGMYRPPPPSFGKAAALVIDVPCPNFSFCAQLAQWDTNTTCRDWVRQQSPGARVLMNIDFPGQIDCFKQLGPDGMAAVLSKVAAEQAAQGFTFIWPIIQLNPAPNNVVGQWDSTQYVLSDGRRLYDVERDLMLRYNPRA
jgi:hypothetical protein